MTNKERAQEALHMLNMLIENMQDKLEYYRSSNLNQPLLNYTIKHKVLYKLLGAANIKDVKEHNSADTHEQLTLKLWKITLSHGYNLLASEQEKARLLSEKRGVNEPADDQSVYEQRREALDRLSEIDDDTVLTDSELQDSFIHSLLSKLETKSKIALYKNLSIQVNFRTLDRYREILNLLYELDVHIQVRDMLRAEIDRL